MIKLLSDFCARHALPLPEPDESGHFQLGFDQIEVSLFEDLGKLYLIAEVTQLPDKTDERERERVLKKAGSYLLSYLYIDECLLNLYNRGPEEHLVLVSVMAATDQLETLETRLSALVNRAEGLTAQLEGSTRGGVEHRLAVFRP